MPSVKDRIKQYDQSVTANANLTLDDIGNMKTASGKVYDAFLDPQLVTLRAGMKLYKFNNYPGLALDKKTQAYTPWWSAYDSYDVDPGWLAKEAMARGLRCSIRELGRVTSAITEGWNSCEFLATITLTVDIKAMYGRFRQMARNDKWGSKRAFKVEKLKYAEKLMGDFRPEGRPKWAGNLPGGGRQFYIPNLWKTQFKDETIRHLGHM